METNLKGRTARANYSEKDDIYELSFLSYNYRKYYSIIRMGSLICKPETDDDTNKYIRILKKKINY